MPRRELLDDRAEQLGREREVEQPPDAAGAAPLVRVGVERLVEVLQLLAVGRVGADPVQARGERVAASGPALGLRDLKWLRPVYAGETIDYKTEITALRVSGSKPRFGLMTTLTTGVNQDGATVISFESTTFVERRSPPATAS